MSQIRLVCISTEIYISRDIYISRYIYLTYLTLQYTATHCSTLQHSSVSQQRYIYLTYLTQETHKIYPYMGILRDIYISLSLWTRLWNVWVYFVGLLCEICEIYIYLTYLSHTRDPQNIPIHGYIEIYIYLYISSVMCMGMICGSLVWDMWDIYIYHIYIYLTYHTQETHKIYPYTSQKSPIEILTEESNRDFSFFWEKKEQYGQKRDLHISQTRQIHISKEIYVYRIRDQQNI